MASCTHTGNKKEKKKKKMFYLTLKSPNIRKFCEKAKNNIYTKN